MTLVKDSASGGPSRRTLRALSGALLAPTALVVLAGCGSTPEVSATEAAAQIADQLEAEVGQRPDEVRCPGDLVAEVGASMRCELSDMNVTYGIEITITEVTDGVATFDIRVDDTPG